MSERSRAVGVMPIVATGSSQLPQKEQQLQSGVKYFEEGVSSLVETYTNMPPVQNRKGVYRYTCFAIWIVVTLAFVLDRFYWNVWPRQTICSPGCGTDAFCDMDEAPGCLKDGPWSAKAFDFIARVSARLIISTTGLMFITMSHGTWNFLSEFAALRPYLYAWRDDNFWLHTIGGWTIGVWTIMHVWSLFLPSMFHGYTNVAVNGEFGPPMQIALGVSQVDADLKLANWGYDDIWRITWMTIIFGMLMPLSRSAWALKKNFSLALMLHMLVGLGFFFDSFRRKTHPHVWILNTPVVLWWLADKIVCTISYRVDPCAEATRIVLDDEYMLLLWKGKDIPKRICDIFWIKRGYDPQDPSRSGKHFRRNGELAHPFTTCSSHDVAVTTATKVASVPDVRPSIEPPIKTDVSWPGHRFTLTSVLSQMTPSRRSMTSNRPGDANPSVTRDGTGSLKSRKMESGNTTSSGGFSGGGRLADVGEGQELVAEVNAAMKEVERDGTMIGVDVSSERGGDDDVVVVVGKIQPKPASPGGPSMMANSVDGFFEEEKDDTYVSGATTRASPAISPDNTRLLQQPAVMGSKQQQGPVTPASSKPKRAVLMRIPSQTFDDYRKREEEKGRLGPVPGSWSKMAIMRVHRRSPPTVRECSCLGVTHILSSFRTPETGTIADLEAGPEGESTLPLRTYGPYRSEYGRLCEFPNLPPLMIIATGAGAALALDFMAYVRANNLKPIRSVTICYSSASLPLLQFVTNTLLAKRTEGIEIKTALTRHDDLELFDTGSSDEKQLAMGRLDVEGVIASVPTATEVFFCGGPGINDMLREKCAARRLKYVGSSVQ